MSSACAKQKKVNKLSISAIDEDATLVTQSDFDRGRYRINLKDVSHEEWHIAVNAKKQRINIMLDASIVSWFKLQAGDRGYQTLINETLKQAINHQDIENILRRVVREELKHAA